MGAVGWGGGGSLQRSLPQPGSGAGAQAGPVCVCVCATSRKDWVKGMRGRERGEHGAGMHAPWKPDKEAAASDVLPPEMPPLWCGPPASERSSSLQAPGIDRPDLMDVLARSVSLSLSSLSVRLSLLLSRCLSAEADDVSLARACTRTLSCLLSLYPSVSVSVSLSVSVSVCCFSAEAG